MKNQELIKYLEEIITHIEGDLESHSLYLCTMSLDLGISEGKPDNLEYKSLLLDNRPTPTRHSNFYKHKRFSKEKGSYTWWKVPEEEIDSTPFRVEINTQRLLFIKHLKEQLEQGKINP